jgi:tetratricopeptide (TPR) repeat protein
MMFTRRNFMRQRSTQALLLICGIFSLTALTHLPAFCQSAANSESNAALIRARQAYNANDLNTAKRELNQVLASNKKLPETYLLLALVAGQEKKNGDAIKHAKEALRLQPEYALANFFLARLYFAEARRDDALLTARLALKQGAEFADAYVLLGDIELSLNRVDPALEAYQKALVQPPPNKSMGAEFKERMEALQNLMEFQANRDEPGYEWPKRLDGYDPADMPKFVTLADAGSRPKKYEFGGILTSEGKLVQVRRLGGTGKLEKPVYNKGYSIKDVSIYIKCSPAKKNGVPVPFWFRWEEWN